jgi:hypothetical protein
MEIALIDKKNKGASDENITPVDQSYRAQSTGIIIRDAN